MEFWTLITISDLFGEDNQDDDAYASIGYIMYVIYLLMIVVILLNLLIAIMNATVQVWRQSYKPNFVVKKTKMVLKSLTVHFL